MPPEPSPPDPRAEASSGSHVVLVVEDEELIRFVATEALEDAGFIVVQAEHAAAAIDTLRERADEVHVLFTDVHMPGEMSGVHLAHETRRCWPWIHLVVTSGKLMPHPDELPEGSRFLPKPYVLKNVLQHISELTGQAH